MSQDGYEYIHPVTYTRKLATASEYSIIHSFCKISPLQCAMSCRCNTVAIISDFYIEKAMRIRGRERKKDREMLHGLWRIIKKVASHHLVASNNKDANMYGNMMHNLSRRLPTIYFNTSSDNSCLITARVWPPRGEYREDYRLNVWKNDRLVSSR